MNRTASLAVFAGLFAALAPGVADAGLTMNIYQSGSNVIASGSGTLDTTDLSFNNNGSYASFIYANGALLTVGSASGTLASEYTGVSGPTSFGPGTSSPQATSGSGDLFGVYGQHGYLYTPYLYVSGTSLSATDTFNSTTLASLGLTVGTYTYTWGTGIHSDSLVVIIGSAPSAVVPEPSSLVMCGLAGVIGLSCAWRRRKRAC